MDGLTGTMHNKSYSYDDLDYSAERDLTEAQSEILLADGFVKNPKTGTWDKYEKEFEDREFVTAAYEHFVEKVVPTHRYLKAHTFTVDFIAQVKKKVQVNRYIAEHRIRVRYEGSRMLPEDLYEYEVEKEELKAFDATYVTIGETLASRFFGFFKKLLRIQKKERMVGALRLKELERMEKSGQIADLSYRTVESGLSTMELTEEEAKRMGTRAKIRQTKGDPVGEKEVRRNYVEEDTIDALSFPAFARDVKILSKEDIFETVDMTADELKRSGENYKLQKANVGTKEESVDQEGHAEIQATEYDSFMRDKQLISKTEHREEVELSEREHLAEAMAGRIYPQVAMNVGKKTETVPEERVETVQASEYDEFRKGKNILTEERFKKRVETREVLVDLRTEMEQTFKWYQPGDFSSGERNK